MSLEMMDTMLSALSCIKKGLCEVGKGRSAQTYRIYYELHGSPQATQKILFVMGLNNSCSGWSHQVEHFSLKPDHQVLVLDNRGVGNSDTGPTEAYKTSEMAKDVVEVLDHLGWNADRSIHLCGVSMGGMISQELCLLIPKRFKSVLFLSTKTGEHIDLPPLKGLYMIARVASRTVSMEKGLEMVVDALFPPEYLNERYSDSESRRDHVLKQFHKRHATTRKQLPAGVFGQLGAVVSHCCPPNSLKKIAQDLYPAKILVVGGEKDQMIKPVRMLELHDQLPGSQLIMMEDGGHALCAQKAERFNLILENLMKEANQVFS